jgi:hypothetical protein
MSKPRVGEADSANKKADRAGRRAPARLLRRNVFDLFDDDLAAALGVSLDTLAWLTPEQRRSLVRCRKRIGLSRPRSWSAWVEALWAITARGALY